MLRDERQLAEVCHVLLAEVGLERLWTKDGPTAEASAWLGTDDSPISSSTRVLFLTAWSLWDGSRSVTVTDIIEHLDVDHTEALCFLLMAKKHGTEAVDEWISEYARVRRTR